MLRTSNISKSLPEQLLSITCVKNDVSVLQKTPKEIDREIKQLEDALTEVVLDFESDEYQRLALFISCYPTLEGNIKLKLINTIVVCTSKLAKSLRQDRIRTVEVLEAFISLLYGVVSISEKDLLANQGGKKGAADRGESNHLRLTAIEALESICSTPALSRLYNSQSQMDHFVNACVKTAHCLLESEENCKNTALSNACSRLFIVCAEELGYKAGLEDIILQDLNYLEHLAEFNGDLLAKMYNQNNNATIVENVLRHLGAIRYSSEDGNMIKTVCRFIMKLTVSSPRVVLVNILSIAELMDCEAYQIRMMMLEVYAVLISYNLMQEDRTESGKNQALSFLAAVEERLRDTSTFVRAKVLQVLSTLISTNAIPVTERTRQIELVLGRIMDKSSTVRKRAIQMLGELLKHHPFCVDGGELTLDFFTERLVEIDAQLDQLLPAEVKETMGIQTMMTMMMLENEKEEKEKGKEEKDETITESSSSSTITESSSSSTITESSSSSTITSPLDTVNPETIQALLMQKRYYNDAIAFVKQLERAFPILVQLLSSNLKTEVFEVMDFLVDAHIYGIQASEAGVKKMMHLIWEQDLSTEDGTKRSIKEHVLACYRRLFLQVDSRITGKERIIAIVKSLVDLSTSLASKAQIASMEEIVGSFLKKEWINEAVIHHLFTVLAHRDAPTRQKGALLLISMIGKVRPDYICSRIESIVKIGLANNATTIIDPSMVEYACTALRQCSQEGLSLPPDNILFNRISNLIKSAPCTFHWLQVITEAIRCLYSLCDQPDVLASNLIKDQSRGLLTGGTIQSSSLTKVIFIVGQVAACKVCHLDTIERHYKMVKTKKLNQKQNGTRNEANRGNDNDGMEGIAATEEDDFTDAIRYVREDELLYGEGSILTVFGSMIATICAQSDVYTDPLLQNVAAISLGKLMAVSGRYCDEHLSLFLTLLEKSPSSLIRANMTVAFADLAQSFGRIIDTNVVYLFRRLGDEDVMVRRSALLVLTHLTLTGMVKVKGQVGTIAKCILDTDKRVANLARVFFHELASKDSASGLYNQIPDMISALVSEVDLTEEDFKTISRFIFDYVKKERQSEGLLEKLCQRLRQSNVVRQSRDLAFCLTLLNYTHDRTIRRFIDSFALFKDKLVDYRVYSHVLEAVQKMLKGNAKSELKTIIEEFKQKVIAAGGDAKAKDFEEMENDENDDEERGRKIEKEEKRKAMKKTNKKKRNTTTTKKHHAMLQSDSSEDSESDNMSDQSSNSDQSNDENKDKESETIDKDNDHAVQEEKDISSGKDDSYTQSRPLSTKNHQSQQQRTVRTSRRRGKLPALAPPRSFGHGKQNNANDSDDDEEEDIF